MSITRSLVIILLVCSFTGMTQEVSAQPRGWERFYEESLDYYVQFGLENGMNVSWAHRFKDDYFIRYGADLYLDEESTDSKYVYPDTTKFESSTVDYYRITLHTDFIKPVKPYEAVRLYVGAGPFVRYYWGNSEDVRPVDPSYGLPNLIDSHESTYLRIGIRGLVGGEYALNSRLSFFAEASLDGFGELTEYELSDDRLNNNYPDSEIENQTTVEESWSFGLDVSSVRIGVTLRYGKTE